MINRPRAHLLVPLLALTLSVGMAATAQAQDRYSERSSNSSLSLQINFGSTPRWTNIRGTNVRRIRDGDRTDYDMFRVGRRYYAYNNANNRWYTSRGWRGSFTMISDRSVPRELRRIPRQHWRNYPSAWEDRDTRGGYGSSGYLQVSFGTRPRWSGISGTRVEMIQGANRPSYDVFRYGGSYYAYSGDRWYSSDRESGRFDMIDDRDVPSEFARVSRTNWRHYPSTWEDRDYRGSNNNSSLGLTVTFGSTPRWSNISGTNVQGYFGAGRPDYDVFRYGNSYYAYNGDRWYSSSRESGQFAMIDDSAVPSEFSRVPRQNWRHYPAGWQNDDNDQRDNNWRRNSRDRNDQYGGGGGEGN